MIWKRIAVAVIGAAAHVGILMIAHHTVVEVLALIRDEMVVIGLDRALALAP